MRGRKDEFLVIVFAIVIVAAIIVFINPSIVGHSTIESGNNLYKTVFLADLVVVIGAVSLLYQHLKEKAEQTKIL